MSGGAFFFDLSGTGAAPLFSGRFSSPVAGPVRIELGVSSAWPEQQVGQTVFVVSEIQLQVVGRLGSIKPYLGVGGGGTLDVRSEEGRENLWQATLSGSIGARVPVSSREELQLELRGRGIGGGFHATGAELTVGWVRRF